MSGLDQSYLGTFGSCGNDIYYEGRNGPTYDCIIYVNGTTFSMQTYNPQPTSSPVTMRQTASGILVIANLTASASTKAVYKVDCFSAAGFEEKTESLSGVKVYPNPSNGLLTIETQDAVKGLNIKIINLTGQVVYQKGNIIGSKTSVDLSNQASGIYFCKNNECRQNLRYRKDCEAIEQNIG